MGDAVGQPAGPNLVWGLSESDLEWGERQGDFLADERPGIQSRLFSEPTCHFLGGGCTHRGIEEGGILLRHGVRPAKMHMSSAILTG